MIVPQYWAEGREQARDGRRTITVRRFGWSDDSLEAAQAHAAQRTGEALRSILAGARLPRLERRTNYGIEGVPIREQVVERHGDAVITRNSYGALCLNTPDVLFADMDFEQRPRPGGGSALLVLVAIIAGFVAGKTAAGFAAGVGAALLAGIAAWWLSSRRAAAAQAAAARDSTDTPETRALGRVQQFIASHPDWHLRVYRTPAGLRVMALHRLFSPHDPEVATLFHALDADRLYSVMCKVQNCFRARLSAKPWRIGMEQRIRPPHAAWSSEHAFLPERLAWIAQYEPRAGRHAACRYVGSLGDESRVDPKAAAVRDLHDSRAGANTDLPLA